MMKQMFAFAGVALAVIQGSAYAQSTAPSQSSTSTSPPASAPAAGHPAGAQQAQNLPREIQQKLTSSGFTDVQVVPGSYLVSAKDKNGDPVTMVIGPHSMTVFTVVDQAAAGSSTGTAKH